MTTDFLPGGTEKILAAAVGNYGLFGCGRNANKSATVGTYTV